MAKRAATKATMTAASWDALWSAYCAAKRSGDQDAISNAKGNVRIWHHVNKLAVPTWAE